MTLRVLILDHCCDGAKSLRDLVSLWGHEAWWIREGSQALAMFEAYKPDVVLIDAELRASLDPKFLLALHAIPDARKPLLLAVSCLNDPRSRCDSLDAGYDHHLVKPIDLEFLRGALDRHQGIANEPTIVRFPPSPAVRSLLMARMRQECGGDDPDQFQLRRVP
jgi:DNA-binding response OmpR family regulator